MKSCRMTTQLEVKKQELLEAQAVSSQVKAELQEAQHQLGSLEATKQALGVREPVH